MDNNNRDTLKTQNVVNEEPHVSKETSASDLSSQRRKIIKASAVVVPALMTLRSGAAAALTSSAHRCLDNPNTAIETISDFDNIDLVLGDEAGDEEPSNDQWLRVAAKPGKALTYTMDETGVQKTFYLIRKDNSRLQWTDLDGWHIYDVNGFLLGDKKRRKLKREHRVRNNDFLDAWKDDEAVTFYGVESVHAPGNLVIVEESDDGSAVSGTLGASVPPAVTMDMVNSTTLVYLLAYYDQDTGIITYHPMPKGDALLITGSCLTSIAPAYQL